MPPTTSAPASLPTTAPSTGPAARLAEAASDVAAATAPAGGGSIVEMYPLLGGVWLGWALGANDASNVFGTAVASRMVRFRTAVVLSSLFVLAGALVGGAAGMKTLSGLAEHALHFGEFDADFPGDLLSNEAISLREDRRDRHGCKDVLRPERLRGQRQ